MARAACLAIILAYATEADFPSTWISWCLRKCMWPEYHKVGTYISSVPLSDFAQSAASDALCECHLFFWAPHHCQYILPFLASFQPVCRSQRSSNCYVYTRHFSLPTISVASDVTVQNPSGFFTWFCTRHSRKIRERYDNQPRTGGDHSSSPTSTTRFFKLLHNPPVAQNISDVFEFVQTAPRTFNCTIHDQTICALTVCGALLPFHHSHSYTVLSRFTSSCPPSHADNAQLQQRNWMNSHGSIQHFSRYTLGLTIAFE
jgi:hypothetical protein